MKNDNIPMLWKKIFLIFANNRDYVNIFCDKPLKRFDKNCRERYFHSLLKNNTEKDCNNKLDDLPENAIYWGGDDVQ